VRIGQGIDAHQFSDDPSRSLMLGLVEVAGAPGLAGHSDADVATHALCDALLGAANLGDLGRHFPSSDEATKGISSRTMLQRVVELVGQSGLVAESADVTILAQRPVLLPLLGEMSTRLSAVVGCTVSVKATTTDALGALGRGEGIAASAVALLAERE
jgi:2-C-methyl-D-erythritol 2,4-cyclodiphosphate synthase